MSAISTALIPALPIVSSGLPNVISVPTTQVARIATKNYSILPIETLTDNLEVKEAKTSLVSAKALGFISNAVRNNSESAYIIDDHAQLTAFVNDKGLSKDVITRLASLVDLTSHSLFFKYVKGYGSLDERQVYLSKTEQIDNNLRIDFATLPARMGGGTHARILELIVLSIPKPAVPIEKCIVRNVPHKKDAIDIELAEAYAEAPGRLLAVLSMMTPSYETLSELDLNLAALDLREATDPSMFTILIGRPDDENLTTEQQDSISRLIASNKRIRKAKSEFDTRGLPCIGHGSYGSYESDFIPA